jgi:hypothetical protein
MEVVYKTMGSGSCPHLNSHKGKSTLSMRQIEDCPHVFNKPCYRCNLASPNKCGDCVHFYYEDTTCRHVPYGNCMRAIGRVMENDSTCCEYFIRRQPGDKYYPDWVEEELLGYIEEFGDERKARAFARKKWYYIHSKERV